MRENLSKWIAAARSKSITWCSTAAYLKLSMSLWSFKSQRRNTEGAQLFDLIDGGSWRWSRTLFVLITGSGSLQCVSNTRYNHISVAQRNMRKRPRTQRKMAGKKQKKYRQPFGGRRNKWRTIPPVARVWEQKKNEMPDFYLKANFISRIKEDFLRALLLFASDNRLIITRSLRNTHTQDGVEKRKKNRTNWRSETNKKIKKKEQGPHTTGVYTCAGHLLHGFPCVRLFSAINLSNKRLGEWLDEKSTK